MRPFRSSRRQPAAPLSSSLPGRRPASGDPDPPPGTATVTPTVALLGIGIVLLAAALLVPSRAPSAVPSGALQPVVAATSIGSLDAVGGGANDGSGPEDGARAALPDGSSGAGPGTDDETNVDLDGTTPEDLWIATDEEKAGTAADSGDPAIRTKKSTAAALEGSSSASVTGDDLTQAQRAETRRRKAAREKRARERKASKARARAAARRAAERRRRVPKPPAASAGASAAPPRSAAAPAPAHPSSSAPPRRPKPSRPAVADEFTGGL